MANQLRTVSDLAIPDARAISSPAARAAHQHLLSATEAMNLRAESHTSAISAVKLYDRSNRYLFSWIINAHHLLFYIRKPALKVMPSLASQAAGRLSGVKTNPAGEVTIRIETTADAEALTAWLFDPATWSTSSKTDKVLTPQPLARSLPSR